MERRGVLQHRAHAGGYELFRYSVPAVARVLLVLCGSCTGHDGRRKSARLHAFRRTPARKSFSLRARERTLYGSFWVRHLPGCLKTRARLNLADYSTAQFFLASPGNRSPTTPLPPTTVRPLARLLLRSKTDDSTVFTFF